MLAYIVAMNERGHDGMSRITKVVGKYIFSGIAGASLPSRSMNSVLQVLSNDRFFLDQNPMAIFSIKTHAGPDSP